MLGQIENLHGWYSTSQNHAHTLAAVQIGQSMAFVAMLSKLIACLMCMTLLGPSNPYVLKGECVRSMAVLFHIPDQPLATVSSQNPTTHFGENSTSCAARGIMGPGRINRGEGRVYPWCRCILHGTL